MTARISEGELLKWMPVDFDDIDDPLATPEPSKGALVELEAGAYVVLYYGKDSSQLTIEIPEKTADVAALIASFLREVPVPISRVLWHRPDTKLPGQRRRSAESSAARPKAKRSTHRVSLPNKPK
ncbi:MAG TPA: hypothetical protein VEK57_09535 [Thermoanaerobaculia bacterium]|nr:hypothetical protein [Thermoanaerobaculia bacterium]